MPGTDLQVTNLLVEIQQLAEKLTVNDLAHNRVSRLTLLLEVVREKCLDKGIGHVQYGMHRGNPCQGTGYVTRNWGGYSGWWLATLLIHAAQRSGLHIPAPLLYPLVASYAIWDDPVRAARTVLQALGGNLG